MRAMTFGRRIAPAVLLISGLLAAGCDGYISPSEHQARLQIADYQGWIKAKADSRDENIREIGNVIVGTLRHGEETSIPLDVTGAHRALVIAACDRQCADLDLRVVTADGRLIGLDEDEDDYSIGRYQTVNFYTGHLFNRNTKAMERYVRLVKSAPTRQTKQAP